MPEYPDITVYIEAMERCIGGRHLEAVKINNPFLLRTVEPSLDSFLGCTVSGVSRIGKRVAIEFESDDESIDSTGQRWMVFHLMIAGRFHWTPAAEKVPGKRALMVMQFKNGYLWLTEAGSKRRASLHLFANAEQIMNVNPGGLEVLDAEFDDFQRAFTASNHTLKRALTDPRILSGIGNAYSDEILHHARLSPIKMTQKLNEEELRRLFQSIQHTLRYWADNLREHYGQEFPEKVTAFREDMAAHGRYGKPCPDCGAPIQRIRYSSNETNYCPNCQTEGRILADRALSRLLKKDWPRTLEELEKSRG